MGLNVAWSAEFRFGTDLPGRFWGWAFDQCMKRCRERTLVNIRFIGGTARDIEDALAVERLLCEVRDAAS